MTHVEVTRRSRAAFARLEAGGWTSAPFAFVVDPAKRTAKEARLWDALRAKRNALLGECDWTQVGDAPLTAEKLEAWKAYRQALRNLPGSGADVLGVVEWPGKS